MQGSDYLLTYLLACLLTCLLTFLAAAASPEVQGSEERIALESRGVALTHLVSQEGLGVLVSLGQDRSSSVALCALRLLELLARDTALHPGLESAKVSKYVST